MLVCWQGETWAETRGAADPTKRTRIREDPGAYTSTVPAALAATRLAGGVDGIDAMLKQLLTARIRTGVGAHKEGSCVTTAQLW